MMPPMRRLARHTIAPMLLLVCIVVVASIGTYRRLWIDPYLPVNLETLSAFDLDAINDDESAIPADRLALNGRKVSMQGLMFAPSQTNPSTSMSEFRIVCLSYFDHYHHV